MIHTHLIVVQRKEGIFRTPDFLCLRCITLIPLYLCFILFTFIFSESSFSQDTQEELEEISMLVEIPGFGFYSVEALYSPDKKVYLAVDNLFSTLDIICITGKQGDSLGGFINSEKNRYLIDFPNKIIKVGDKTYPDQNRLIQRMGLIYMESSLFKEAFGLELKFNFRSLVVTIESNFELPVIKKLRLEKIRNNIRTIQGVVLPDTTIFRKGHLFRAGTLNWAVDCSQLTGGKSDNRIAIGLGGELLYGSMDIFLNYSTHTNFNSGQQYFLWRWVDNTKKLVRQIMAGRISGSSISTIYSPMYGAILTNTPTTIRKATGFHVIKDYTEPDWVVELYLNNVLVDYAKADAAGMFTFKVPVVYGYTTIKLKFFGPNGEERADERTLNVPYNFLPNRTFEYRVSGAIVSDSLGSRFGRGELSYGLGRKVTLGAGVEYLSSVTSGPFIPFVSASVLPLNKVMIMGTYAYGVGFNGAMNLYLPLSSNLQINYIRYAIGQTAIQYNYREQRAFAFTLPVRIKFAGGSLRLGLKQDVYSGFTYNQAEFIFTANYRQFSGNFSTNANWVTSRSIYAFSNLALGYRLKSGLSLRTLGQINVSARQLTSIRIDAEKRVLKEGFVSLSYDWNIPDNYHGINITFRYNLPFAQTAFTTRLTNQGLFTSEGATGSVTFGSGNGFIDASNGQSVSRGGLTLIPFIDKNHNGVFDADEHIASGLVFNGNGGRMITSKKDSLVRIFGLEPFSYFDLELREVDFDNLSWRLKNKSFRILIDPNQFKRVEIPITPMGEIVGMVYYAEDSLSRGMGRIQVNIFDPGGKKVAQTLSESDGYMSYLGLVPGDYYAQVDAQQLGRISFSAEPSMIPFTIKPLEEGDVVEGMNFVVRSMVRDTTGNARSSLPLQEIPVIPGDTINSGQFMIEIGPFGDDMEAMNIQTKIKAVLELNAIILLEGGRLIVQVKPFTGRQAAEAIATKITNLGIPDVSVKKMK